MNDDEPTQHTPKGAEIPVPRRDQVLRDFEKAMKPVVEHTDPPAPREAHVPLPGEGNMRKAMKKLASRSSRRKRRPSK